MVSGTGASAGIGIGKVVIPVSYTHLDVYKRQESRSRRRWRWFCGSWFRRRKEAISAIVSFTMDGTYALPEQSRIANAAAWLTSARKQEYKISVLRRLGGA